MTRYSKLNIKGKPILDACCGSKMFWFDKNNPNVLFADIRNEDYDLCDGRKLEIYPDIQMDFFRWFNGNFKGSIIHWTNFKY